MPLRQLGKAERPRILIVDDEPQVAGALADLLEDRYVVAVETSPHAALARLEADKRIAVVISDQRMPGMTGDRLFMQARQISVAARILITAYADIAAVIDAINQGQIFAYATKPWQPDDIVLTVKRAAEHYELNRRILQSQELLSQLMESSVDAIAIKDRSQRYLKLNRAEAHLLGADDVAHVEGRTAAEFLSPDRLAPMLRDEAELLETGAARRDRVARAIGGDSPARWYESNIAPIRDLQGDVIGIVRITRDVSETKRLDEMKDQFIATVRHELRTPLTAIHGALGLLRGGMAKDSGQIVRLVEIGYQNCARLLALIADLLDTVSLEKGEMQFDRAAVDISDIVAQAIEASAAHAGRKGIRLIVEPGLPRIEVEADRERVLQVLGKLIANAIDATLPSGEVRIGAHETAGGTVRFAIIDQGPGVRPELQPLLFKRFSQGDSSSTRPKGGVGLGLYIAKSIVEAHHGTIGFINRSGQGAEFYAELPICSAPAVVSARG
jgi:two-component system cell cycle sensor histidine kinase PleC